MGCGTHGFPFQLVMSMTAVRVGSIVFSSSESDDFFTNTKTSFRVDSREFGALPGALHSRALSIGLRAKTSTV
jgi:hypothetical protein